MKLRLERFIALPALCLLMVACAQTGPPLPPSLELPKPPADLRASRKGNRVTLNWSEPTLTTDRQSVRYIGPTLICRSAEPEITVCGNPVATVAPSSTATQNPAAKHSTANKSQTPRSAPQSYTDTLPSSLQQQNPAAEITYAVEVLNRNARGEGLSNRVHVPAIATLPPPSDLAAELTGDGVVLTWTIPRESTISPGVQVRYRIYRHDETSGKDAIAGEIPADPGPAHFTDSSFDWGSTYLYRVTAVSIVKLPDSTEVQIEGDDTAPLPIVARDIFPPSIPTGLQAAYSGEGQKPFIDLIWAPVTNADLAGYNIYRREANGPAVKLNPELVKSPAYRDTAVASGKTYTYSVSAVDARGNESQHSEETSEPVP
jgi:hypothetical protein